MLEVKNLNVYYDQFHVIKDVSLQITKGQFVVLFGPNGHGKSTLLKTICGLIKPKSGKIIFNDVDITNASTVDIVRMGLIYVAEVRHLFPEMTVMDNLKLGAYNRNARVTIKENLDLVFTLFPRLKERRKQMAATLSGGEAQMLALGRGLMSNALLMAIDEPSLGLAPNLVMQMFGKISEINKTGISILLVEQSIIHASSLADLIYIIEDGNFIFQGSKDSMLCNEHIKEILLGS